MIMRLESSCGSLLRCSRLEQRAGEERDDDPESIDEIPYEGSTIDLGEAAAEQLALALDPYPHKPGATLPDSDEAPRNPAFAALAGRGRR